MTAAEFYVIWFAAWGLVFTVASAFVRRRETSDALLGGAVLFLLMEAIAAGLALSTP